MLKPRPGYIFGRRAGRRDSHLGYHSRFKYDRFAVVKVVRRNLVVIDLYGIEPSSMREIRFSKKNDWVNWAMGSPTYDFVSFRFDSCKKIQTWIDNNRIDKGPPHTYPGGYRYE